MTTSPTMQRINDIAFYERCGFTFVKLREPGSDNAKKPFEENWQNKPYIGEAIQRHSGNIGVHTGRNSGRNICIDIDVNFQGFLETFPKLKNSLIIDRDNDPFRGKVVVKITDRLPLNSQWKADPTQKRPDAELLATSRQIAVIGIHPSGAPYQHNGKIPLEMTFAEVAAIWRRWTGQELGDPIAPKATERTQRKNYQAPDPKSLLGRIKASCTPYDVFQHFGQLADAKESGKRLTCGYTVVNKPGTAYDYSYFDNAASSSGGVFHAWASCTGRELNKETYPVILREMAAWLGIKPEPDTVTLAFTHVDPTTGEIVTQAQPMKVTEAIPHLIAKFTAPDAFPKGRSLRYDRAVMLKLLDAARRAGRVTDLHYSARSMGDDANIDKLTASKALRRLIRYGYIVRSDGKPFFDEPLCDEFDEQTANMICASSYSLTDEVCKVRTLLFISSDSDSPHPSTAVEKGGTNTVDMKCTQFAHLDANVLDEYVCHDAFAFGAKLAADDEYSLGKAALDVIAALSVCNDLTFAEIAENSGMSRSTASKKAKALAAYGLVELYTEGRATVVYLVSNWRDRLDVIWQRLTTYCRNLKRSVNSLQERIRRLEYKIPGVTSGKLHQKLSDLIAYYRQKLFAVGRRIAELQALRAATATIDSRYREDKEHDNPSTN